MGEKRAKRKRKATGKETTRSISPAAGTNSHPPFAGAEGSVVAIVRAIESQIPAA
jgi:hypothetical protein